MLANESGHAFTEETLLEDMKRLEYSLQRARIILTKKVPIGYYESAIERERKWNTKLHIPR